MSDKEIIKELDKVINNNKDRTFMTGELNYVAMAESCKVKILDLQNQLQQKENIIKEVREFAKLRKEMYERQENVVGQEAIISLLEILDKGE